MAVGDIWRVTATIGLRVRTGPSTSYQSVKVLPYNATITEIEGSTDSWIHFQLGYSSKAYLVLYKAKAETVTTTTPSTPVTTKEEIVNTGSDYDDEAGGSGYRPDTDTIYSGIVSDDGTASTSDYNRIGSALGVFGLPYQFLPNADARLVSDNSIDGTGREYSDKIVGKIPIFFIAPGRPDFMTKYSDNEKKSVGETLVSKAANLLSGREGSLDDLLSSNGKYYTFRYDIESYYKYVNPMCRIAARYLELQDYTIDNTHLDSMDWREYVMNRGSLVGNVKDYTNIPFYIDSETSINESFDSQLTESSLASTVNGISDLGRELNFLTGYTGTALDSTFLQDLDLSKSIENVNELITNALGQGNFLTNLTKHLSTVSAGGRLIFPKIWSDSSMSRQYNIKIKLVSPDANKLSVFLNVLVPLFHLLGLVAPQSIPSNPNGYTSPFIVRAMYKSFFNVDMGIITSMSIDKGAACGWTVDGIPTSIEVDMTIKDLYDMAFTITPTTLTNGWKYDTLDNTAQMDYIANLCGINMYKPEIGRQLSMWIMNEAVNKAFDIPRNIWSSLNSKISGTVQNFFRN